MSYIDQENGSRRVAVGGVVLLHIAVGYALISGFAINVIRQIQPPIIVREIPDDKPPLPHDEAQPKHKVAPDPLTAEKPIVTTGTIDVTDGFTGQKIDVYPVIPTWTPPREEPPQRISHARGPVAGPSRATWVTTVDYPSGPLRDGIQGVVGINVAVGTDGRVTGCEVTASSGSDALDQATCRLYARRARFQPALDDDAQPTVSHHNDRIRWQIPE